MDEMKVKHALLEACDVVGFPEGKKYGSARSSFTDGISSTDGLSDAAGELGQDALYILSNMPKGSPAFKQMKGIIGEIFQCWDECGTDESSRKEETMLAKIKALKNRIKPLKDEMMKTNANPHAVCLKEVGEMITGMEYLFGQYQKTPKKYPGYDVLGEIIPKAKALLASLKNVSVYSTVEANEKAKALQSLVMKARDDMMLNVYALSPMIFDQMATVVGEWNELAVNAKQKTLADKARIGELEDDEVDYLLGFVTQENDIIAFISKARAQYTTYKERLDEMSADLSAIEAKKEEIKRDFQNGRIKKEDAIRKINELNAEEKSFKTKVEQFKRANRLIAEQYKFAEKIENMYFFTMENFPYKDKAECFKTGEAQVGINLREIMGNFRGGLTTGNPTALQNANDTLNLIIEIIEKQAAIIAKNNPDEIVEQTQEEIEEQNQEALDFLLGTEDGGEVEEITEDPFQETNVNAPQRQRAGGAGEDDFGDIFGERVGRQKN